jgi:hypothetical protein|tara:strand:+ start:379 stop:576 length:198 start_codon:yes stop_codon:yes gene_type:complete
VFSELIPCGLAEISSALLKGASNAVVPSNHENHERHEKLFSTWNRETTPKKRSGLLLTAKEKYRF